MLSPAQIFLSFCRHLGCASSKAASVFLEIRESFPAWEAKCVLIHNCGCNDAFGELKSVFTTNLV